MYKKFVKMSKINKVKQELFGYDCRVNMLSTFNHILYHTKFEIDRKIPTFLN